MRSFGKKVLSLFLGVSLILGIAACGLVTPCGSCGRTPSNAYPNKSGGKTLYRCDFCTPGCAFCTEAATLCYDSILGTIFACNRCYNIIS